MVQGLLGAKIESVGKSTPVEDFEVLLQQSNAANLHAGPPQSAIRIRRRTAVRRGDGLAR